MLSFRVMVHVGWYVMVRSSCCIHHQKSWSRLEIISVNRGILLLWLWLFHSVVTSPRHVIHPSVFAFSYVPDNVCHTTLWVLDPVCTLSVLTGWLLPWFSPSSFGLWPVSQLGVAKRPGLTAIWIIIGVYIRWMLSSIQFSLTHFIMFRMMLSSLQNAFHSCTILLFISCESGHGSLVYTSSLEIYVFIDLPRSSFRGSITSSLLTSLVALYFSLPQDAS